jgi:hypothetical protein
MANNITQTTLSAAVNDNATFLPLTSVTNIVGPTNGFQQKVYIIDVNQTRGSLYAITAAPTTTGAAAVCLDEFRSSHTSGSLVMIAPSDPSQGGFYNYDPVGNPGITGTYPGAPVITPWLNVSNGNQWITGAYGQWVAGWNNPSSIKGITGAVASAAGAVTPSGPLFRITGTNAITGFNIPTGFAGGSFSVIPQGAFTWTSAGNIAIAGTAVVNRMITFTWDDSVGKWIPSYV